MGRRMPEPDCDSLDLDVIEACLCEMNLDE